MDIPDEAWVAAHSVVDPDLDEVVRAAAPHIERAAQVEVLRVTVQRVAAVIEGHARSARVAILREVVAELRRASWTSADPVEAEVAKGVALAIGRTIERKADELDQS